jgi:GAF domain-containing protein
MIDGAASATVINSPDYDDRMIQSAEKLSGMRIALFVPLRKNSALLGYIVAGRPEVGPFTDKQIALLQNFAAQAVIAMENARLLTETREALEQQTATSEVLQVINSSPGDLGPVFDAMLEKAMLLCEASAGAFRSYEGNAFHAVAMRGVPTAFAEATQVCPKPQSALGRIEHGEKLVQITDLADPDDPQRGSASRHWMVDLGGIRTALWVALRKSDDLLGTFVLYRNEMRPFSEKQIGLVNNFAEQAVVAMENARLITETREALEQQTATAEVLQVINSSPGELQPVFEAILEKAHILCGVSYGSLQLYDGEKFRAVAVHGLSGALADRLRQGSALVPRIQSRACSTANGSSTLPIWRRSTIRLRIALSNSSVLERCFA